MKKFVLLICLFATFQLRCSKSDSSKQIAFPFSEDNPPTGMVFIQGGTFAMGNHTRMGSSEEYPVHDVSISSFFMDTTEVTCEQFNAMGKLPIIDDFYPRHPVHERNWYSATEYCNFRSKRDGLQQVYEFDKNGETTIHYDRIGYRLPTEAEWEYACRAGTTTRYYWGDDLQEAEEYECVRSDNENEFETVASKQHNPWGLYDMLGNAQEWCNDWYLQNYYELSSNPNPTGPVNGDLRVVRGGMCSSYSTCSFRSSRDPKRTPYGVGFRCVLPAPEEDPKPSTTK